MVWVVMKKNGNSIYGKHRTKKLAVEHKRKLKSMGFKDLDIKKLI